jgi:hypothetical protein
MREMTGSRFGYQLYLHLHGHPRKQDTRYEYNESSAGNNNHYPEEQEKGHCFITNSIDFPISQTSLIIYPTPIFNFTPIFNVPLLHASFYPPTTYRFVSVCSLPYYICRFSFYIVVACVIVIGFLLHIRTSHFPYCTD